MTEHDDDDALRALFAELRAEDAGRGPAFDALARTAPRRAASRRLLAGGLLAAACVLGGVFGGVTWLRSLPPTLPRLGVADPEPTAFLASRPTLSGETP